MGREKLRTKDGQNDRYLAARERILNCMAPDEVVAWTRSHAH